MFLLKFHGLSLLERNNKVLVLIRMDYEVCRKVWESQVAVQFVLESPESGSGDDGEEVPFYTMLPRCSYFPIVLPKALSFFATRDPTSPKHEVTKVWLESNGIALKPYLPIGVLCDMYNDDTEATWNIVIKTSQPPDGFIGIDKQQMESIFIQSIKEADYLKKKAETMNSFEKSDYNKLWESLINQRFDDFWSINKKLVDTSAGDFQNISIRLHMKGKPFRQALIAGKNEEQKYITIGEAVNRLTLKSSNDEEEKENSLKIISHGIEVPPETPLVYAVKNLAYPDNFVHLAVN